MKVVYRQDQVDRLALGHTQEVARLSDQNPETFRWQARHCLPQLVDPTVEMTGMGGLNP
jgi:hypothetical protein